MALTSQFAHCSVACVYVNVILSVIHTFEMKILFLRCKTQKEQITLAPRHLSEWLTFLQASQIEVWLRKHA